jgi:CheY-like chemotaxis protein
VTGHHEKQTYVRAESAGIVAVLDKPLRVGNLRDALGRALAAAH